jgi:hypothetical protein
MDPKEAREWLRSAGFSSREIARLLKLRQKCSSSESPNLVAAHRRLEFARWLFVSGKLSE